MSSSPPEPCRYAVDDEATIVRAASMLRRALAREGLRIQDFVLPDPDGQSSCVERLFYPANVDGEPIDLLQEHGMHRLSRWRHGAPGTWQEAHVAVGTLADWRWFLEASGRAWAFPDEDSARAAATGAMAERDGWVEEPAEWGPDRKPTDLAWRKVGRRWLRDPDTKG